MKSIILFLCLSALSLSPIRADDACCESKSAGVETKLREIDLSILLKKYQQLQSEKAKAEIQLILLQASDDQSEAQLNASKRRIEILGQYASQVRSEIEKLGQDLSLAAK